MGTIQDLVSSINGIVWGPAMLVLILGTGAFLHITLRGMPVLKIFKGLKMVWQSRNDKTGEGEITPFAALMTALAATVGTGNIAGVGTAIALGGPGALFWMWCTALVGMATKYAEVVVAVEYREVDANGEHVGGPMYAIKNGLGKGWGWLGATFAIFGGLAGFGIGNMVQVNAITNVMNETFGIPAWGSAVVLTILTGAVILGGIKRIGKVAESLVPLMCLAYVATAFAVLVVFAHNIPNALELIFYHAFNPVAAAGGAAGVAVWAAMRYGVARGVFSNEAGLGTAGIAQAAGNTNSAVKSGLVGMMGTFIDTLIICTMTGLAIVASGTWDSGASGAVLTGAAFEAALPGWGQLLLTIELAVFAFTTILGWSYYGEKCWEYLLGEISERPYRVLWTLAVPVGALLHLDFVWLLADTLNAFMAIPNLIALIILSPVVVKLTREYFATEQERARDGLTD